MSGTRARARSCAGLLLAWRLLWPAPVPATQAAGAPQAEAVARARALLRSGDDRGAESLLRTVLETHPRHGGARVLLGRIALERGELEPALAHLEIAVASGPPRPYLAWHLLGRARLGLGRPAAAADAWSRSLELAPRFAPALLGRARAALRLQQPERAVPHLERVRTLGGPQPEATLLLAELHLLEERSEEAARLLEGLAEDTAAAAEHAVQALGLAAGGGDEALATLGRQVPESPHMARVLLAYGVGLLRSDRPEAARRWLRAALEVDDQDPVPWLFLRRLDPDGPLAIYPTPFPELPARLESARRLAEDEDAASARAALRAVLERRPHHLPAHLLLIRDAERRGDAWAALAGYRILLDRLPGPAALAAGAARVARAVGALDLAACQAGRALEASPRDPALHFLLAAIHSDAGRYGPAAESSRRAIALGLEEAPIYLTLGLAEFESMRIPQSIAAYARALELDPETHRAIPRFALASLSEGELGSLRRLLETRVAAGQEDDNTLFGLGSLSLRSGDLEGARNWFERLAALTPDDARVFYQLGSVYLRQGRREQGESTIARFRELKAAEDEAWLEHNRAHARRLEARAATEGGDPRAALRIYAELAAAGTAELGDYLAAGRASLEIGDHRRAYGWFEEVLTAAPHEAAALAGLATAAEALGRPEAARQARERLELLSWPCAGT